MTAGLGRLALVCALASGIVAVATGSVGVATAAADAPASSPAGTARQAPRKAHGANLDDRVKAFALGLNLDAEQQSKLKRVLENQRDQVRKVWDDQAVPAPYRVNATRVISDQAADQIRALLTEEQRKKYDQPRRPREPAGRAGPSVDDWIHATQTRPLTPSGK